MLAFFATALQFSEAFGILLCLSLLISSLQVGGLRLKRLALRIDQNRLPQL